MGPPGALAELEGAAHHSDALADPDQAEPAALRRLGQRALDLEAHSVVDDLELDRAPPRTDAHGDRRRAGVLADVRKRLLDRTEHRDALSRRERVRIPAYLEVGADAGAVGEPVDLAMQDLAERSADDALRLE